MRSSSQKTSDQILVQIFGFAKGGHVELVQGLLGGNPEKRSFVPAIVGYAQGGHEALVNGLLVDNPEDWKVEAAIEGYANGGHEVLVQGLLGDNPENSKFALAIQGYARGGHEAVVNRLLGENPEVWKVKAAIQGYEIVGYKALVHSLILNTSHNLLTSEFRKYLSSIFISIPLLSEANNGLLTALKEKLQIFNPANSDKTPLSDASSSRAAEVVETKATAKLSESDYKDLIKIISEQIVIDGEGLNIKRYINILDQLLENINRDNKRLESREDDEVSLVQSLIEDYCSGSSLSDLKEALAREQALTDDKAKLQIVEKNGFLGKILAARYDNKQTAGDDSIKEYNERPAKKARVDSTLGIT